METNQSELLNMFTLHVCMVSYALVEPANAFPFSRLRHTVHDAVVDRVDCRLRLQANLNKHDGYFSEFLEILRHVRVKP